MNNELECRSEAHNFIPFLNRFLSCALIFLSAQVPRLSSEYMLTDQWTSLKLLSKALSSMLLLNSMYVFDNDAASCAHTSFTRLFTAQTQHGYMEWGSGRFRESYLTISSELGKSFPVTSVWERKLALLRMTPPISRNTGSSTNMRWENGLHSFVSHSWMLAMSSHWNA